MGDVKKFYPDDPKGKTRLHSAQERSRAALAARLFDRVKHRMGQKMDRRTRAGMMGEIVDEVRKFAHDSGRLDIVELAEHVAQLVIDDDAKGERRGGLALAIDPGDEDEKDGGG